MLSKEFFLKIGKYANENWKANMYDWELEEQAEEMSEEYSISKADGKFTHAMETLVENLTEDIIGSSDSEPEDILNTIMEDFRKEE